MKIIKPSVEFITPIDGQAILKHLEQCGRVCYKSEGKIVEGSAEKFLSNIIKRGHEAVLEHYSFTVKFTCDRGVSHEIVRHRLAAYCQESTRYCNYSGDKFGNEITVIMPCWYSNLNIDKLMKIIVNPFIIHDPLNTEEQSFINWYSGCQYSEVTYFKLLELGCTSQEARAVLPNSLKTEVVMTANIREWRHFFKMRCSSAAHPQMREVAIMLLNQCKEKIPILFDDINPD